MKRMTGSQRKAKKKQRALSRTPKGKRQSGYITLYHGSLNYRSNSNNSAHSIRHTGFKSSVYSTNTRVRNTLTTDKKYAQRVFGQTRPHWRKKYKGKLYARGPLIKASVITVKIPRKKAHEYLVHGLDESRYFRGLTGGKKQSNDYGIRKPIPSKYIK